MRERSALHDASLSGYKDHTLQKNIWKTIATEMSRVQECHMYVHLLTTCIWLPWKFWLRITEWRVRIQLEARIFPNLNGVSLQRVHPSIVQIRLKYCWKGRKPPRSSIIHNSFNILVIEKKSVFWLGLGCGGSIYMVPFSEPFWCLCLWHMAVII